MLTGKHFVKMLCLVLIFLAMGLVILNIYFIPSPKEFCLGTAEGQPQLFAFNWPRGRMVSLHLGVPRDISYEPTSGHVSITADGSNVCFERCLGTNDFIVSSWLYRHNLRSMILSGWTGDLQECFNVEVDSAYTIEIELYPAPPAGVSFWLCFLR